MKIFMRQCRNLQYKIGDTPFKDIEIDMMSRDDIPALLLGLQYIYVNNYSRNKLFSILETEIIKRSDSPNAKKGRPGMTQCRVDRLLQ